MSKPYDYAVAYRGRYGCPCQVAWLKVFEELLRHEGILESDERLPIMQMIGGAVASAGFHARGGCTDWRHMNDRAVWLARQMGADATWHRLPGWEGNGKGSEHDHSALTACPHMPDLVRRNQVDAVVDNYAGLGHLGHVGRDTGPRPLSGRTWQEGIKWAQARMGNAPMTPAERAANDKRFKALEDKVDGIAGQTGVVTLGGARRNIVGALKWIGAELAAIRRELRALKEEK